jgi:predicted MFS family arabinose efflux permease
MAVTNEIVPIEGRGRYFGSRNFIMNIAGMAATLLAGKLITIIVAPIGFQVALAVALVLGISSTFSYFHIQEEPASENPPVSQRVTFRNLIAMFKDQPQFIALTLTAALWNFAINIAGPFFNVQMVQNLKFSAASVGFLAVVMSLTGLLTQNQVGALADRVGARRLQLISMCLIPILPLAWIFATQVWHIALINLFSGVFWGAFNLVSFNLLLNSVPQSQVPRYSAVYQVVVMLSLALGALVGSAVITRWGFIAVVIASSATRFIAAGLFARFVRDPRQPTQAK